MVESEQTLFDVERYESPECRIPWLFGAAPDVFLEGSQYIKVVLSENIYHYVHSETPSESVSSSYADDNPGWSNDFTYWQEARATKKQFIGYLGGFPVIENAQGQRITTLHMWENNSSVLDATFSIPLAAIKSIARYTDLRRRLEADRDELAMGDAHSLFNIVLVDTLTGQEHTVRPEYGDIEHLIAITDQEPEIIYECQTQGTDIDRLNKLISVLEHLGESLSSNRRSRLIDVVPDAKYL